jgi:ubiquinone/menaquinone biosynthesis C-methylase UbiE
MGKIPRSRDQSYESYRNRITSTEVRNDKQLNSRLLKVVDAIPAGAHVLDVACGTGRVLQELIKRGLYGTGDRNH